MSGLTHPSDRLKVQHLYPSTSISVSSLSRGAVRSEEEGGNMCCILQSGQRQPGCERTFLLMVSVPFKIVFKRASSYVFSHGAIVVSVFKRVSSYVFTHGAKVVSVPFKRVSSYVFSHGAIVVSVFKRVSS